MWRCFTCGFTGDDPQQGSACCEVCSTTQRNTHANNIFSVLQSCHKVCHKDHEVAEVFVLGDWFCDCGAGLNGVQCQLLDEEGKRKRAEDVLEESEEEGDY
jgi:hypothetical protein